MTEGPVCRDDITIKSDYEPYGRASDRMTADKITIIAGDFNIPLSIINSTSKQRIGKDKEGCRTIN